MPLGMEIGLGPDDIVLDGAQRPKKWGTAPNFRPMFIVAKGPSQLLLRWATLVTDR